ncbi:penicillin-binding protein 2 [Parvibium lacunae]|uniref:Peptidoglycan D,D-transpeptidase MrdA n=1 Tax=Parvibium lacunae TaxID=1888893 RepID=A0A368L4T1_9BURK|nr:penicillin-binding protein 2 [Parvibium lacunae]RCS58596.1 penicillin-binding protein 2 [Parvibium lacunae]
MTDLGQLAEQLQRFRFRALVALGFVCFCFSLLIARFVYLQVVRYEDYKAQAEDNRISIVPITPNRGLILDRNGVVLARNYSAYTLEITPSKLADELEYVIDELAKIIEIQARDRKRFKKMLEESKSFESLPIRTRLSDEEVARFAAHRYRFPGVDIKARLFRDYPLGEIASHVIGYIGRISQKDKQRIEEWEDAENYAGTEYIGKEGLEKRYEKELHGLTGYEEVEVSAGGRAIRTLSRSPAQPGNNLILSIDVRLQELAEQAFGDRKGALVAIEPKTGDILAFVSKPTFDPNLFVDGIDVENWKALNESPDRPLLNRPLSGTYPIGSTYKPFMALAALELGKRTASQAIADPGFFQFGNHRFRDDKEGGHGYVDMYKSIVVSCDTYYYLLARDMGIQAIHDFMQPFGFGQITGIDLDGEKRGILPSPEWKRKAYKRKEQQRWYDGETISVGIGQGYNAFTILQLAHATSTLANSGIVMKPHLVKMIENIRTGEKQLTVPKESYRIPLKEENLEVIRKALIGVTREGTSARAFAGTEYVSAGKTGTAQVIAIKQGEKYDAKKIASHFHDHALYMAFAPADEPKIALAVIVENGGFGAQAAAPIARQVFDYWLLGKKPPAVANGKAAAAPVVEVSGD